MLTSLFAHAVLAFAPVPRMATPTIGGSLFPLRSHHAHAVRMMDGAISIGTPLPDVDVEIVPNDPEERGAPKRVNIKDALGDGKTVLLGMPGAFTPTCNDRHLPGYYTSSDKLKSLGVSKVAVVTMNDRFVNAKWQADMEECTGASGSSPVMLRPIREATSPKVWVSLTRSLEHVRLLVLTAFRTSSRLFAILESERPELLYVRIAGACTLQA